MKLKEIMRHGHYLTDGDPIGGGYDPEQFQDPTPGAGDPQGDPAPSADAPPAWFDSFRQEVTGKLSEFEQRFQPPRQEPPADDPWQQDEEYRSLDQRMAQHTNSGMRMMGEMMRPIVETQVVQQIAGQMGPEAQAYIRSELKEMDPLTLANLAKNPSAMRLLTNAAKGIANEAKPPTTQAPQTEQVRNNASNLDSAAEKEIDAYLRAFGRFGATREMAIAAYKRATGGN